jgi:hypothetical protein
LIHVVAGVDREYSEAEASFGKRPLSRIKCRSTQRIAMRMDVFSQFCYWKLLTRGWALIHGLPLRHLSSVYVVVA